MNLQQVSDQLIDTSMQLLPARMYSAKARVILLAIGLQESRFEHTHKIGGPAHGYWQFESGGGVKGVMNHEASKGYARDVCARLLLWTDPRSLPEIGAQTAAWDTYIWNWRPGKPHPNTWPAYYQAAQKFIQG